jgi:DNA-binding beta-propeller fold protein YncE
MIFGEGEYSYKLVSGWAKLPAGQSFPNVTGIAIDSGDNVYVMSKPGCPVTVFDRLGNVLNSWGEGYFVNPHGIHVSPDNKIYCTDIATHTVLVFTTDGRLLHEIGTRGKPSDTGFTFKSSIEESQDSIKGGPPFNSPTSVALDNDGNIFVADGYGNSKVHRFSSEGQLLLSWGNPGRGVGQFRLPHHVFVDVNDRVWICDRENNRVQVFNRNGEFLFQWQDLLRPTALAIDKNKTVYISELGLRVSIFDITGKLLTRWSSDGNNKETDLFVATHSLAVDLQGDIYVGEVAKDLAKADRGDRTLLKFIRVNEA